MSYRKSSLLFNTSPHFEDKEQDYNRNSDTTEESSISEQSELDHINPIYHINSNGNKN